MRRRAWLLAVIVALVAAIAVLHDDFGVAWDDEAQVRYGELVVSAFASGLDEHHADAFRNLRYYAPHFELLPALIAGGAPQDPDVRHLLTALLALLTVPILSGLARHAGDGPATSPSLHDLDDELRTRPPSVDVVAAISILALVTLPRFVGHAFTNVKDVPFAVMVAAAMLAYARLAVRGSSLLGVAMAGLATGLALGARPGGLPLLAGWLAIALGVEVAGAIADPRRPPFRAVGRAVLAGVAVLGLGWIVMVVPWPWAHLDPIGNPWEAITEASSFSHAIPVLHRGELIDSTALPLTYLFEMLLVTIPLPHLVLALCGMGFLAADALRSPFSKRGRAALLLLSWIALPLAGYLALHPPIYDGMRHFLFLLPAVALLVGVGAARLARKTAQAVSERPDRTLRLRRAITAGFALALATALLPMARLHPYESTYFNALVGGVGGAAEYHDTDYWLLSYREAMDWIARRESDLDESVNVLVAGNESARQSAAAAAAPNLVVWTLEEWEEIGRAERRPELDYLVATTRFDLANDLFPGAPVLHAVGRDGAVFAVVKGPPDGN